MRFLSSALCLFAFCGGVALAQAPETVPPSQAVKTASAIMQPALDMLREALNTVRPDKWKGPGAAREEAAANIGSIRRDLDTTLPSLLANADGAPNSVVRVLPAYRNIEALYDVLLRVTEVGNLSAPKEQAAALEDARASLESGRRTLGDNLQAAALAQEKQVHDLQAAIRATPPAPAPVACPAPPPAKKRKTRKKTVKKPATAATTSPSKTTSPH